MKVLLINPVSPRNQIWSREGRCQQFDIWGAPFPPLSLAYIKTQLKGITETLLLDPGPAKLSHDTTWETIKKFDPGLIIMSTVTPTFQSDTEWFAKRLKEIVPGVKIGAIGIHVTALPEMSLTKAAHLDFVIKGEPEPVIKHLVECLINKDDLGQVDGLCYRENGDIKNNKPSRYALNVDDYGIPDWTDINFENYLLPIKKRPFSFISFSRGCPYPCQYCAAHTYYGKKIRKRSVESILSEIDYNMSMGVHDFLFWTEMINSDPAFLTHFLDVLIQKGYHKKIQWVCNSRVDNLPRDVIQKLYEAGCWQVALGLEFGTNKALKLAQKGGTASVEKGREVVSWLDEAGIVVDGHFILGFPGETSEDIRETINYAASLPLTFAHFYYATPFPGSELYDINATQYHLSESWEYIMQNKYVFANEKLTEERINSFMKHAYLKFYLSPKRFWKIFKIAHTMKERFNILSAGSRFIASLKKL